MYANTEKFTYEQLSGTDFCVLKYQQSCNNRTIPPLILFSIMFTNSSFIIIWKPEIILFTLLAIGIDQSGR